MSRLLLFIYLHPDESNPAEGLMKHIESDVRKTIFSHVGVTRLGRNVYLFDETKAHGPLSLLCAEVQKRDRPYLLVPVDPTSSLLAGTPPKDILDILVNLGVPCCLPLYIP